MREIYVLEDLLNTLIELEIKSFEFYEKCSKFSEEANLKQLFQELSIAEKHHEIFYKSIKEKILNSPKHDLEEEYQQYIKTLISNNFFIKNSSYNARTVKEALDLAEGLEKDTILFLTEFANIIIEKGDFNAILKEEKNHLLRILTYKKEHGID